MVFQGVLFLISGEHPDPRFFSVRFYRTPRNPPLRENQTLDAPLPPSIHAHTMPRHGHRGMAMVQWNSVESSLLITLVDSHGKKWSTHLTYFPGRTPTQLRNRYNRIMEGRDRVENAASRNKCRLCGELRAGHICKGHADNAEENEAAVVHVREACEAASVQYLRTKGDAKPSERRVRSKKAKDSPSVLPRPGHLPPSKTSDATHANIVEMIVGGGGLSSG